MVAQPTTPTGVSMADGEDDDFAAMLAQVEAEARRDVADRLLERLGEHVTVMGGVKVDGEPPRSVVRIRLSALTAMLEEEAPK